MQIFQNWTELGRIALTALFIYAALILYIKVVGIRSISQLNNFDWVVTVAVGSAVASVILFKDVVLFDGLTAIFALLISQYLLVRLSLKSKKIMRSVHQHPVLLFHNGQFLHEVMQRERVMKGEILSAIRQEGYSDLAEIAAVVLEPNANLSVIQKPATLDSPLFEDVRLPM